jgi:hypothetical protein
MKTPFFILSEEQAKAIKAKWWWWARFELIVWAIVFALGYAALEAPLRELHWPAWKYWAIVGCSLLLFSRMVIWLTFFCGWIVYAIAWTSYQLGHPMPQLVPVPGTMVIASALVMLIRSPLGLFFLWSLADTIKQAGHSISAIGSDEEATKQYDWYSDEYVYESGLRVPANLRRRRDEGEDNHRW